MSADASSREPLRAGAGWFLGHGLGNDYLVFTEAEPGNAERVFEGARHGSVDEGWPVTPEAVRTVCDRHLGPGADGVVVALHREGPDFRLRMFNPDGSEFERSGNGLRVFAAWARLTGRVGAEPFEVEVGGDTVTIRVHDVLPGGEYDVSVDMGRARVGAGAVGFEPEETGSSGPEGSPSPAAPDDPILRISLGDAGTVEATPVSVGNPHCVVFPDRVDTAALERLGPALATHPAFRAGVNVQLASPLGPGRVRALIWERGVGRTTSSGTSSCAVAAAAVQRRLAEPGEIEVAMEGGSFRVTVSPELDLRLRGPVRAVGRGRLDDGYVEGLAAS